MRFIIRYLKTKRIDRKKLSENEVSFLMDSYNTILEKLNSLTSPVQKAKVNSLEAEKSSKQAQRYIVPEGGQNSFYPGYKNLQCI